MSLLHTIITRLSDNLVLCETETSISQEKRSQVNQLLQRMTSMTMHELIVESTDCYFAIIAKNGVCYLTVCDKSFSKRLAFAFLNEIQKEFETSHGNEVKTIRRPYACMVFGTFIQKTEKIFSDSTSKSSIEKVQEDLKDVQKIMTQNVQDILERGQKLSVVSERSDMLLSETSRYHHGAKDFQSYMQLQRMLPYIVVAVIILLVIFFKVFVF